MLIILHDGPVYFIFDSLHSLHVILDIAADACQSFQLNRQRFSQLPELSLGFGSVSQHPIVGHVFLDLEQGLELPEVLTDLSHNTPVVFF